MPPVGTSRHCGERADVQTYGFLGGRIPCRLPALNDHSRVLSSYPNTNKTPESIRRSGRAQVNTTWLLLRPR